MISGRRRVGPMASVLTLLIYLAVVGCGATVPAPQTPHPSSSATDARTDSPPPASPAIDFANAPPEVTNREPLPFCGWEMIERTTGGDVYDAAIRDCFWSARDAGEPAEFISTGPTVEGDPITTIYRLLDTGELEILIDWSRDRFGPTPGWTYQRCESLPEVSEAERNRSPVIEGSECDDPIEL